MRPAFVSAGHVGRNHRARGGDVLARAKDVDPEAIFVFVPGGAQSPAIAKALADRGVDPRKTKVVSQTELTAEWT